MTQLATKHMFSDKKWYGWLNDQAAVVGRCYGLALELKNVPSKTANNLSVLNHRPVKFDMDNDYKLLYRITYRLLANCDYFWWSSATFLAEVMP